MLVEGSKVKAGRCERKVKKGKFTVTTIDVCYWAAFELSWCPGQVGTASYWLTPRAATLQAREKLGIVIPSRGSPRHWEATALKRGRYLRAILGPRDRNHYLCPPPLIWNINPRNLDQQSWCTFNIDPTKWNFFHVNNISEVSEGIFVPKNLNFLS